MADFEQFNTSNPDSMQNPFIKARKGGSFSEILRNKNSLVKYVVILAIGGLIIILSIFISAKSSQLSTVKDESGSLNNKLMQVKATEHDLKQQYTDLINTEKNLVKENEKLMKSINNYKEKNQEGMRETEENNSKLQTVQQELTSTDTIIQELSEQNDTMKKKIKSVETSISEYEKDINDGKVKISEIERQIDNDRDNGRDNDNEGGIDSEILWNIGQVKGLKKWLNQGSDIDFKLLYRATKHGYGAKEFHSIVDKHPFTLLLLKDGVTGSIIGGYTTQTWDGFGFKKDDSSFVFNLTDEEYYEVNIETKAIYCNPNYGIVFGEGDIYLSDEETSVYFPISYGDDSYNTYALTGGKSKTLKVGDMEVFQIIAN